MGTVLLDCFPGVALTCMISVCPLVGIFWQSRRVFAVLVLCLRRVFASLLPCCCNLVVVSCPVLAVVSLVNAVPLPWLCRADFRPVDELPGEGQTEAGTAERLKKGLC